MERISIPICENETLSEAMERAGYKNIPANAILDKTLTGIGATYMEIIAKRHSIIIEPNIPVIIGKAKEHKNVLAVYDDCKEWEIKAYLQNTAIKHKKILTTPEGFKKIRTAAFNCGINIYTTYFCLFDECEKLTQDVGYRENITNPVYDFFSFTNKAFVSATPLEIRHPELEIQGFKRYVVVPEFDYRRNINLIITNSFAAVVTGKLHELRESEHICIFYNSIDGIEAMIQNPNLNIGSDYMVFCSPKSAVKLKTDGFPNAQTNFSKPLPKFSFFTSRFYSAFDIKLENKRPDILLLTNTRISLNSTIDPKTEAIQIQGRFRKWDDNILPYNSLTHITNFKSTIAVKTDGQLDSEIEQYRNSHQLLTTLLQSATNADAIRALKKDIKALGYSDYLDEQGNINYFAIDNRYNAERVKGYYTSPDSILNAYNDVPFFNVIPDLQLRPISEDFIDIVRNTKNLTARFKLVAEFLTNHPESEADLRKLIFTEFEDAAFIFEAIKKIGMAEIIKSDYGRKKIQLKIAKYDSEIKRFEPPILKAISDEFELGVPIKKQNLQQRMQTIYNDFGIVNTVFKNTLNDYFDTSKCSDTDSLKLNFILPELKALISDKQI
jgi:hypothetical protein